MITSIYAVTQEEALKVRERENARERERDFAHVVAQLAGLQVQVVYGDHNPTTHVPGFLTNNKDIANFIPIELYPQRKPAAWEEAILKGQLSNAPVVLLVVPFRSADARLRRAREASLRSP